MCPATNWQIQVLESREVTPSCLWTSTQKLQDKGVDDVFIVEFCSLINRALHRDIADVTQRFVVIVRAMCALCIVRRDKAALKFPPDSVSLRDGALPAEHHHFFPLGTKYRVSIHLATSFKFTLIMQLLSNSRLPPFLDPLTSAHA